MLASPAPVITPYDPGQSDPDDLLLEMDLGQSLQQYIDDRRRLVARLQELSPSEWTRAAEHGEYSHYSAFIMFRHLASSTRTESKSYCSRESGRQNGRRLRSARAVMTFIAEAKSEGDFATARTSSRSMPTHWH
jgi:hypothetical protein